MQTTSTVSQDLSEYKWKNRVLMVLTNDLQQSVYIDQLTELQKDTDGLIERKY